MLVGEAVGVAVAGWVGVLVAVAVAAMALFCWASFMLTTAMMVIAITRPRIIPAIILMDCLSN